MVTQEKLDMYEPTIGIECHVQLNTATKLFAAVSNDDRGKAPNTTVSPICFGLPGTLPVLNEKATELGVRAGIALNAEIAKVSSFDRKHYFYPDLPKGYQITQLDRPIVGKGEIEISVGEKAIKVRITRAHLEEDAGKSVHPSGADYTLVDLNRAGTPLLEVVSEADMHSAAEAKAYVQELYLLMKYAGVTLGDLQHGNMRFDVNVSVAKKDADKWGTRVEVKNLNSFRAVERAVEYEVKRHVERLEKGERIHQETRGWDDSKQKTTSQRSKEEAQDYRYFPDPDIPPVVLTDDAIEQIRDVMPQLPPQLRKELEASGLDQATAETLILQDALESINYVPTVLQVSEKAGNEAAKFTANFLAHRDIKHRIELKAEGSEDMSKLPDATQFVEVFEMVKANKLSSNGADQLLFTLKLHPGAAAHDIAQEEGLLQESDESALQTIIEEVLADPASQKAVEDIKAGQTKAIGYLVGQVMKKSKGKANPGMVSDLLRKQLN
ncbi:MAG: Asp-tRNA(Asn)/Glu-tRNA(Gln) amidotransferase subunit GatB [Candidatus Saccharimonadales bacterium]